MTGADRFPSLDVGGSATTNRVSSGTESGVERDWYEAGFDAGWEIDIFGGVRRSVEAAEADLDGVRVSLAAEVARTFIDACTYQYRLDVALAQDRYTAGLVDFSNVLDAQRSLLSFQDALAGSEGTVTTHSITLYKALGGGWEASKL